MESEQIWKEMFHAAMKELRHYKKESKIDRYLVMMLTIAVFGMAAYVWLIHLGYIVVR